ncbi:MAG: hypothetical protein V1855_00665 [bacterium]
MKFLKGFSICFAIIVGLLSSLQGENQVNLEDPQVIKQQTEDVMAFAAMIDPWKNAIVKYSEKNGFDFGIKCKNCAEGVLLLGEFDGCLLAWITKAIPDGHDAFEKIKVLVEAFIKLLSDNASSEELINFMLKTSNDIKQFCFRCHGVEWKK